MSTFLLPDTSVMERFADGAKLLKQLGNILQVCCFSPAIDTLELSRCFSDLILS